MRGEDALAADFFDVRAPDGRAPRLLGLFAKQFEGEKRGVALVHVVARQVVVAKRPQDAHPPDSQQNFLAQAVVRVASIQSAGEIAVELGI